MLPRYVPAIDLGSRLKAVVGPAAAAQADVRNMLGLQGWKRVRSTAGGRFAISAYFRALSAIDARRTVLLSAQICPIVPLLLIKLGFRPWFVDVAEDVPTPGITEFVPAFHDAGGADAVAAVILSPFYGYLPRNYDALAGQFTSAKVVLDLAQATLAAPAIPKLLQTADAAVFSFGIGKGADLGGGLLAVREDTPAFDPPGSGPSFMSLNALPPVLALRCLIALGLYRHVTGLLDDAVEAQKTDADIAARRGAEFVSDRFYGAVTARLTRLSDEFRLAGSRASELHLSPRVSRHCKFANVFGDPAQMHLRQIIRLADPGRREEVLGVLRREGVDALPAGEPSPAAYLGAADAAIASSSTGLVRTSRFLADAIRLPFLGRIDPRSFTRLIAGLEKALG